MLANVSMLGVTDARCKAWILQRRVQLTYHAAVVFPLMTMIFCYACWLLDGCAPLVPFISDLGLRGTMRQGFRAGLLASGLCLALTCLDAFIVRCRLLKAKRAQRSYAVLNFMMLLGGAGIAGGVAALGFFPWDVAIKPHLLCANTIFYGGTAWASCNAVLMRRLSKEQRAGHAGDWVKLRVAQGPLLLTSIVALILMLKSLGSAFSSEAEFATMLKLAQDNFPAYCHGKHLDSVGRAALFEWLLVISLIGSVATWRPDFELYFAAPQSDLESNLAGFGEHQGSQVSGLGNP